MIRRIIAAALLAVALPAASIALAQGASVPANKTTEIGFMWAVDVRTCGNLAKPKVDLRQPKHGKVTTKWIARKFSGGRGSGRKCNGRLGKGTAIYYTPNKGYRGPDGFRISVTNRLDGQSRRRTESVRFRVQ